MTTLLDRFSKTSVAIEFKEDILIVVCLKNDLSGVHLLSSSTFPQKEDDETVAEINKFIVQYTRDFNNIFVSIPHKWSIIKFIEVPSAKGKGKNALSQMMRFEIERHIPFQIEDVFYDFQLVEKSETAYTTMFAVVHKEKIDYVKGFLEKISLQPRIITLSPFAALNSVEFSEYPVGGLQELLGFTGKPDILGRKGELCILLFVEKNNANFTVLKNGLPVLFKSSHVDPGEPIDVLTDNIAEAVDSLLSELSIKKMDKLILSGAIYHLSDLPNALSAKIGTDVKAVNPVLSLLNNGNAEEAQKLIPSVGVYYSGLGIGSSKINLLPHKTDIVLKKTGALLAKISIPLIFLLAIGIFVGEIVHEKKLLTKIEEELKSNKPEIKVIEKISTELGVFEQQRNFLRGVRDDNAILDILSELSDIIPTDAWLTNFNYKKSSLKEKDTLNGELLITGFAASSSALISILEDSPFFENVEFVGPITKKKGKEGFKIKADTVKPAALK